MGKHAADSADTQDPGQTAAEQSSSAHPQDTAANTGASDVIRREKMFITNWGGKRKEWH